MPSFYLSPLFLYEPGQRLFRANDPARTPLIVQRLTYGPDGRSVQVLFERQADSGRPHIAYPHFLVHIDKALRPTFDQLTASRRQLMAVLDEHTADCQWCKRTRVWCGTAYRCLMGKRMVDAVGGLDVYLHNVATWLTGQPLDPAYARLGQKVTVRPNSEPEFEGVISPLTADVQWHEPGQDGQYCVRRPGDLPNALYLVDQVYPLI
ncbi:hypothetical protein ABZ864_40255 [Streptomyces sp. NPDC047082]|uniref:hypothetical protein n=1 Tax=Streptomyces sp. NPDC047082 TaxID=3155259 RepID=UPI0033C2715A